MRPSSPDAITVIVPLHNGARFIAETLDSLATQTWPLSEVIVVDDGSTDDGPGIAASHRLKPRLITQERAGVAVARNRGALAAGSRWIAFLDQDDLWLPTRHERLVSFLQSHRAVKAVITNEARFCLSPDIPQLRSMGEGLHQLDSCQRVERVDELLATPPHQLAEPAPCSVVTTRELLEGTVTVTTSYVFERELFFVAGGCATFARSLDDYWALLNISRLTEIVVLDEPSIAYRIHPHSTTMTTRWAKPLLSSITAARLGDSLIGLGAANDPDKVPLLNDRRGFWRHQLLTLAREPDGYLDSLAFARLLAGGRQDLLQSCFRVTRARLGRIARAAVQSRRDALGGS